MPVETILHDAQTTYAHIRQSIAEADYWREHYLDALTADYRQRLVAIGEAFRARRDAAGVGRPTDAQDAGEEIASPLFSPWAVSAWDDPGWDAYSPRSGTTVPATLRIGRLALDEHNDLGDLPALLALIGQGHIFLSGDDAGTLRAILQAILLRLIVAFPPRSLRLSLADPAGLGANLAAFLRLPTAWRGEKVCSRSEEIGHQLDALERHIEAVLQDRLRNIHPTLEAYNEAEGEMAVPYHIFALADFPAAFDDRMAERLLHIARNGPRVGVYLLATVNNQYPAPRHFDVDDLISLGTQLRLVRGQQTQARPAPLLTWHDSQFGAYPIIPDPLPPPMQVNAWLDGVRKGLEEAATSLDFRRIAIPAAARWRGDSTDGLSVPIGLDSAGGIHRFEVGQDGVVHHGLIGGITRSGKTNLLHILITQLALAYSPDELQMYLVDLKEGVAFQDYLMLPHARVVALESEREFAFSILRRLQAEMEERGRLFKSPAHVAEDIPTYRRLSGQPLPRLLLIMDEFQVLFSEDDFLAREAARLMEDLVRRGAGFGMHLLLSSQSPSVAGAQLARIYNQMGLRIALRCRAQDAQAILGEGNDAANQLSQPGEAIYNDEMGHKANNVLIRVALLPPAERQSYLHALRSLAGERSYPAPVVFAAHEPARLAANTDLLALLAQPAWPAPQPSVQLWLGEPIEIKPPTTATLERYMRSNLLVVGGDDSQAYGVLGAALLSLAAQRSPAAARFVVADFTRPTTPLAAFFPQLAAALPHPVAVVGPRQAAAALDELAALLTQRQNNTHATDEDIYFFIPGLRQWRDLRGADAYVQSEAAKKLTRLADEGPELGLHLLLWVDSVAALEPVFKRGGLAYFDPRVALHLSETDSSILLGHNAAARLSGARALYRHEDWELGRLEKFKPYAALDAAALHTLFAPLRGRNSRPAD